MFVKLRRALGEKCPPFVMRFIFNLYPPLLAAGIRVEDIAKNRRYLRVRLKLRFYNRNYVGTQFGGSLYSMTDPHYMYMLICNLGDDYIVWDKAAKIEFVKPGRGDVIAEFRIDDEMLATVRERTASGTKYVFDLPVTVRDLSGETIAKVVKTLYVRKKRESAQLRLF